MEREVPGSNVLIVNVQYLRDAGSVCLYGLLRQPH
jgi:hypothetical protein